MTEAYIFDYVKTPRGRGKSSGSLHEITPIDLLTQVLKALKDRSDFDPLITT
jgi:acetyl-CoA C-acetyltransferase